MSQHHVLALDVKNAIVMAGCHLKRLRHTGAKIFTSNTVGNGDNKLKDTKGQEGIQVAPRYPGDLARGARSALARRHRRTNVGLTAFPDSSSIHSFSTTTLTVFG